jgi:MGT family glycosyltransferase
MATVADGPGETMKSFLFVTWWGGGNQNPLLALGTRLQARGHRIRVLGSAELSPAFAAEGFERVLTAGPMPTALEVLDALQDAPADAIVVDYMATEALCGAERSGVPTTVLVHTLYRRLMFEGELMPMMMAGSVDAINRQRVALGLAPVARLVELLDRAHRALVTTIDELDEPASGAMPANVRYVGPILEGPGPDAGWSPPWPAEDRRPLVVVCLGTTPMGEETALQRVLEAARGVEARVFVTAGAHLDTTAFEARDNLVIEGYVRHAAVLPLARLLVTHAGLGSVAMALSFGVPMVCLPLGREQPANAARVEALGAGRTVAATADVSLIQDAIEDVLSDPAYAQAARQLAGKIDAAVATDPAVRALEAEVDHPPQAGPHSDPDGR